MPLEVQVGILDQRRVVDAEGDCDHALAERRQMVEAGHQWEQNFSKVTWSGEVAGPAATARSRGGAVWGPPGTGTSCRLRRGVPYPLMAAMLRREIVASHPHRSGRRRPDRGVERFSEGQDRQSMERLSGLDANFLYNETPTEHMHTLKLAVLDPPEGDELPWELIRGEIASRMLTWPAFHRRS